MDERDSQPFAIARVNGKLTVMAGLWETWTSKTGETRTSCTVITTVVNSLLSQLHDRMPVILSEEEWPLCLGEVSAAPEDYKDLLDPFPSESVPACYPGWP